MFGDLAILSSPLGGGESEILKNPLICQRITSFFKVTEIFVLTELLPSENQTCGHFKSRKCNWKALFRLASPPHPNLLPDPGCCILSTTYVTAVGFFAVPWSCEPGEQWLPSSCHCSFPKQKRTNRMRPSAYLRVVNTTSLFKAICQTAGFRRKIYQARVWRNSGCVFFVGFFFPLSFFHLARIKYFVFLFFMHQHATMGLYYFIRRWIRKKSYQCSSGTSAGLR